MTKKIIISASWDGRDYYPPKYVNILYAMCRRHTSHPFDFILFTGPKADARRSEIHPDIEMIQTGLPYWWPGMNVFRARELGITSDIILHLDLDLVIIGSLDDIIALPYDIACMKDIPTAICSARKARAVNVSVTLIRKGAGMPVWSAYEAAGKPVWDPLTVPAGAPLRMGAQEIIDKLQIAELIPEEWVCSYKYQVKRYGMPQDCRVVVFHGQPKPHDVNDEFVKENWRE